MLLSIICIRKKTNGKVKTYIELYIFLRHVLVQCLSCNPSQQVQYFHMLSEKNKNKNVLKIKANKLYCFSRIESAWQVNSATQIHTSIYNVHMYIHMFITDISLD
jgi:hypothetical protein